MTEHSTARFSDSVRTVLTASGWFPGRRVEEKTSEWVEAMVHSGGFVMFPEAERVLLEFGGLRVEKLGPGEECYRDTFVINPLCAIYDRKYFAEWELLLGEKLFPLGDYGNGLAYLAISESGRVFSFMGWIFSEGESFEDALENLIAGRKSAPLEFPVVDLPIFLDRLGDVLVFGSAEEAASHTKATDVLNNEYVGYDSEGRLLELIGTEPDQVEIQLAERDPRHSNDLANTLRRFLAREGMSEKWLSTATLADLVVRMHEYKIR